MGSYDPSSSDFDVLRVYAQPFQGSLKKERHKSIDLVFWQFFLISG